MRYILILLISFFSGCTALQPASDIPKLGESVWKLIAIGKKPVNIGAKAFIEFNEKDEKISGKAGCNSYFADYELIRNNISFGSIGSTKLYCEGLMDEENQIIAGLQKTKSFEVKADFLYLYAGQELLLTFKR